jgi:phage-related protein
MARLINSVYISGYVDSLIYQEHDVVSYGSGSGITYYVSSDNNHSGQLDTVSGLSNDYWKKFGDTGSWRPDEIWTSDYTTELKAVPRNEYVRFGDGYEQRLQADLFVATPEYSCVFDERRDTEAKSLLAFLDYHAASLPFKYKPDEILQERTFIYESYSHVWDGYNTHNISVVFQEVI